jgi:maltooligosyltrehalose trehalohydrolase
VSYDEAERWAIVHRGRFRVAANFADVERPLPVSGGEVVLATGAARPGPQAVTLGPQTAAIIRLG